MQKQLKQLHETYLISTEIYVCLRFPSYIDFIFVYQTNRIFN